MPRSRLQAVRPAIWAIPVSPEIVALWCELPAEATDVALALGDTAAQVSFKRRLITRGRRLHLFVFRASEFRATEPCTVAYRPERGKSLIRFQAPPSLADWSMASVWAAVHAVVDGLASEKVAVSTGLLARFLSMTCSWAVPCRYDGSHDGFCVGVFDFLPTAFAPLTVLAVTGGQVTTQRVLPVSHDDRGCCLVWEGDPFDRAYLDLNGELLELKLEKSWTVAPPLTRWFTTLALEQQDAILDALDTSGFEQVATVLHALGTHLPPTREFRVGGGSVLVSGVFGWGRELCLTLSDPGDRELSVSLSLPGQRDWACVAKSSSSADAGAPMVLRANVATHVAEAASIRVTVGPPDLAASHWLPVQGLECASARRRIRTLIDWGHADEHLVRDVGNAMAVVKALPEASRSIGFALSTGQPSAVAALFLCRYGGDLVQLRSTLIALRLTAGDDVTVRLVCHERPGARDILDLRGLSQSLGLAVDLVVLTEGAPFSDALRGAAGDPRRAIILADSGVVPLDRDWWSRLAGILGQEPALLCYGLPEGLVDNGRSALTYLAGPCPLLAVGPELAAGVLCPDFDLQTFEGVVHHALAKAGRLGIVENLGWLRLFAGPNGASPLAFGAARLDDAVIAAALGAEAPRAAKPKSNLLQLAPRAGAG